MTENSNHESDQLLLFEKLGLEYETRSKTIKIPLFKLSIAIILSLVQIFPYFFFQFSANLAGGTRSRTRTRSRPYEIIIKIKINKINNFARIF